jgi:tetratricopeptide (TPR) repeat protein
MAFLIAAAALSTLSGVPGVSLAAQQGKKPVLIRDTDTAEGKEERETPKPKEFSPIMAEKSLKIGDFYYRKRNYDAAVDRYLEALEYQPDLNKAHQALDRACPKAIESYKEFIKKNPDSPLLSQYREKTARMQKIIVELKTRKHQ